MDNSVISSLKGLIPRKGSFAANVLTLMTGTTLAQGLTVAIAPILTRLYSPEDFGIMAIFLALSNILLVIASWRYEAAIVLPHDDADASALCLLSLFIVIGMSTIIFIAIALFRHSFADLLKTPEIAPWLWLLPANLFMTGIYQIFSNWGNRKKQFNNIAISRISQSVSGGSVQLGLGFLTHGAGGLIAGLLLGNVTGAGVLIERIGRDVWRKIFKGFSGNDLKGQAHRYRKFPQYTAITALLNTVSNMLPSLCFSTFFGPAVLGYYFLATRILSIPLNVIGNAFSQVFYQKASEHYLRHKDISNLIIRLYKSLLFIVIIPLIILFIYSPDIFSLVFGKEWRIAGEYNRIILPWITIGFMVSPASVAFLVLNKQEIALGYEIILFISRVAAILYGGLILRNPIYTIGMYASVGLIANSYLALKIIRVSRHEAAKEMMG